MRPRTTKTKLCITIDKDILEKLQLYADKENRDKSNFVETVLMRYFEEHRDS